MTEKEKLDRGSRQSIEQRIIEYLPLVRHIVGRLGLKPPAPLDMEDLYEVGAMGLVRAAYSYRDDRNASFKTHAYHQIRGAILDELRRHSPLSRKRREQLRDFRNAYSRLQSEKGRTATHEEIADALGIDLVELNSLLVDLRTLRILSLNEPAENTEGEDYQSTLPCPRAKRPDDIAEKKELQRKLESEIKRLPEAERTVLLLYYHEGLRLREIGELLSLSESRISQIHSHALLLLETRMEQKIQSGANGDCLDDSGSNEDYPLGV